ncbi:flippase [Candidatus Peregrinibacteria bacterium]|nr:MAG: flippase [Candidatus Peregrinibacteria bacterium]
MSTARRILANTFVQFAGKLITAGLSIVVLKLITGYLGASGYGDYTTIYQFLAFFGIAADFGIYTITVKEMSKPNANIQRILGNAMSLRTVLIIITMALALIAAFLIPKYHGTLIPIGVAIATLATFFTLLNGTISSVLQVYLKMQYATISLIVGKVISVGYMIWAVTAYAHNPEAGFYQLMWSGVIGNGVMFFITAYYTRRYTKITYAFDFAYWKQIFYTSLPFGVALILNTIYFRLDILLMNFILPHSSVLNGVSDCVQTLCGDTENGLYGVAMRMLEMLIIIPVYFMNSVLPVMTRYMEEQKEKVQQLIQYSFDFLVATSMPILVGGFILAKPIVLFISDPEFVSGHTFIYGADIAMRILMFAMMFSFLNALFGFTLVVLNRQKYLMYINFVAVLFNLVSNIFVIKHWGFRGAAFTSVLSELIILLFIHRVSQREMGFKLNSSSFWKYLISSLLMGLIVFLGYSWLIDLWFVYQLAVLVPLGGLVYLLMVWKTGAVTPEMLRLIKK